ncbi:carbon-nitrogen hydrolase family protein [Actinoplanes sp. CA-030573]|uniref:carbon-nitrogen hydrolase family protein n=1 Tax=Actinoplanes sp. CA-030573 TaxID=3239898 RepID=UPI003D8A076F
MHMSLMIAQVPVVWDVAANLATVHAVVAEAAAGDVVVMPEGMLSGYGDDLAPLDDLSPAAVLAAADDVAKLAVDRAVHIFCGSLFPAGAGWCNAGLLFAPDGGRAVYRKINLAMNERGRLVAGSALPLVPLAGDAVTAGIQLCREIRFPEQWQHLAAAGAQIFVYLTHAANVRETPGVWRSHLVSRAAENQRFLAAANVAHPDQHCPTMLVSPRGEVLAELPAGAPGLLRHRIDLAENAVWYLGQRRADVLSLTYHA